MRTKGFIFIALGVATATLAGSPGYLPSVGPIGLQFAPPAKSVVAVPLPVLPLAPEPVAENPTPEPEKVADIPVTAPAPEPPVQPSVHDVPAVVMDVHSNSPTNAPTGPLIGPTAENNTAITPQMFIRFFSNKPGHDDSPEAIIAVPPGFNPAQPPASSASSTATYSQPKP